jgi:hypothetical protein
MAPILMFRGIELQAPGAAAVVDASLALLALTNNARREPYGLGVGLGVSRQALIAATSAANAMLAMAAATCTLDRDPSDIEAVTDANGDLVLRCGHSPPHEWDYATGQKKP